jgi:hypothetical protein
MVKLRLVEIDFAVIPRFVGSSVMPKGIIVGSLGVEMSVIACSLFEVRLVAIF